MKKIDERVLRWFVHNETVENARIAKRAYVGECNLIAEEVNRFCE